jgi:hypothetical protein
MDRERPRAVAEDTVNVAIPIRVTAQPASVGHHQPSERRLVLQSRFVREGRIIQITEDVSFVPEAGQSITTAQQQMVRNVAQQIVNQMEAPW